MADNSASKELVRLRTGRTDLEGLLRELYVERRWTHQEIADHFRVSRTTVVDWCQEYGISRADRVASVEPPAEATA